jgi:hypothetical protein
MMTIENEHKLCHYYFELDRVPVMHPIGEDMFSEYWRWIDGRWRNYHDWYVFIDETKKFTKDIHATTKGPETVFAWECLLKTAIQHGYKHEEKL